MAIFAVLAIIFGLKQAAIEGLGVTAVGATVLGVAVGVLWVRRQQRLTEPMVDIGLFRQRRFSAALVINFLAIFVAVGYFLFVAQYLQLVAGLSPLQAGLWSLPSAIGFIVGSQAAPHLAQRLRPAYIISGGLLLAAVGLALLAQVGTEDGLPALVTASVIISLGLAPVFGLTTEMIVGAAPPEKAGAASGVSETGAELGGALGIAVLGTVGVAIYRSTLADELPAAVPDSTAEAARDTLGAAVTAAERLPDVLGAVVVDVARDAFVQGMQLTAGIAALVAAGLAVFAYVMLRPGGGDPKPETIDERDREPRLTGLSPLADS
jgi:DHA2 family multidrug resistance protein-like MFS transporter